MKSNEYYEYSGGKEILDKAGIIRSFQPKVV